MGPQRHHPHALQPIGPQETPRGVSPSTGLDLGLDVDVDTERDWTRVSEVRLSDPRHPGAPKEMPWPTWRISCCQRPFSTNGSRRVIISSLANS